MRSAVEKKLQAESMKSKLRDSAAQEKSEGIDSTLGLKTYMYVYKCIPVWSGPAVQLSLNLMLGYESSPD